MERKIPYTPAKARVERHTHRSGNTTYKVYIGKSERGTKVYENFRNEPEANAYVSVWNAKLEAQDDMGLADLDEVNRAEIRAQILRCKRAGIEVRDAVDFYLKFNVPSKHTISVEEAVRLFLEIKHEAGQSRIYIDRFRDSCLNQFKKYFRERIVTDITPSEARAYLKQTAKVNKWSPTTKRDKIMRLTVFYNTLMKAKYAKLNPFAEIERPKGISVQPTPLKIPVVKKMLNYALDNNLYEELAVLCLVLFCGVRQDEASKVRWNEIDLKSRRVVVRQEIAKKKKRRSNSIPDNAIVWLKAAKEARKEGPLMPVREPKQRLKRLRNKAGVSSKEYGQNGLRDSFTSYHIALHEDAAKTSLMLANVSPANLYNHYLDFVTKADAIDYFEIIPREQEKERDKRRAEDKAMFDTPEGSVSEEERRRVEEELAAERYGKE